MSIITILPQVISVISAVVADLPTLITILEKLIAIFKEDRVPTADEWKSIDALVDASHAKLQGE
ncbi:hypothetical protein [Gluconobacter frateurii]|uniref:Uncharacterized protein n=1 Tax=Gluconobacter frateurii NRIC 0228 TaxID=1307946 RepID=A0ABQ0QD82_9PROT|nr:hypothetical protein [Gluconobacter frateurii]GBR14105.1 hypothetical protein AA0228_2176 [Gluconobacter frateurii NRIC 0228]GLP92006.1 hypothetical protein GCM10007868_30810 [Gluconobacter frateurii]